MNIEFRVWDKSRSRYNTHENVINHNGMLYEFRNYPCSPYYLCKDQDNFVLQLSTGLLDSKGKKIYDGDICKAYKPNSYLKGNYEVAWHTTKGRWYYKNQPSYKDLYQVGCAGNLKCEIIGNIYENPELIS